MGHPLLIAKSETRNREVHLLYTFLHAKIKSLKYVNVWYKIQTNTFKLGVQINCSKYPLFKAMTLLSVKICSQVHTTSI